MSNKTVKRVRQVARSQFNQDFSFFVNTLRGWPFKQRLSFCWDVLTRKI